MLSHDNGLTAGIRRKAMGTRSITHFYNDGAYLGSIGRWMDGYLSGHGRDIRDILGGKRIIKSQKTWKTRNGYNNTQNLIKDVFRKLQKAGHDVFMDDDNRKTLEYIYTINIRQGRLYITISRWGTEAVYDGLLADMPVKNS